jgi:hypothetical protein
MNPMTRESVFSPLTYQTDDGKSIFINVLFTVLERLRCKSKQAFDRMRMYREQETLSKNNVRSRGSKVNYKVLSSVQSLVFGRSL